MSSQDALDHHQVSLLSDETLLALQLEQQPFGPSAPDAVTFSDETSAEQLADVKQALITGDDLLLILGEPGAGKSVLLNQLGTHSGLRIQCFAVKGSPRFSTLNLFAGMLEAFKRKPPEKLKEILDELIPCLQTLVARNTLSAIILDDAHLVNESELTQLLSGMLYVNSQDETLMRVALAAPPEFEDRIPDLLPEGADLPYSSLTIDGMSPQRAADYLSFRLQQAGYTGELPFSDRDVSELVDRSGGFPSDLHAAAADALNHQYGPVEHIMPADLMTDKGESLLQSRIGKFGLGALATLLIIGGLTLFMPDANRDDGRYVVAENEASRQAEPTTSTLRLVEDKKVVPLKDTTDASADSASAEPGSTIETTTSSNGSPGGKSTVNDAGNDTGATVTAARDNATDANATGSPAAAGTAESPVSSADAQGASPSVEARPPSETETGSDAASSDTASSTASEVGNTVSTTESTVSPSGQAAQTAQGSGEDREAADTTDATTDTGETPAADETAATGPVQPGSDPDVDPALADVLESPTWILMQDAGLTTVQMSASRDRPSIENFLKRNRDALPPPNSIYTFERNGDTWYALLHGLYPSFGAAQAAVQQMPAQALTNQPWIRNVGKVQEALKAQ